MDMHLFVYLEMSKGVLSHTHNCTHERSSGSSNSNIQEDIMLVPNVAMRQPTAGPTAAVIEASPATTRWMLAWMLLVPEPLWGNTA